MSESAKALKLLEPVITLLTRNGLAPTPRSYHVVFDYLDGQNKALTEEFDDRLNSNRNLTEDFINHLYRKYISSESDNKVLEENANKAKKLLSDVAGLIDVLTGDNVDYGKELDSFTQNISSNMSNDDDAIKPILDSILEKTRQVKDKGQAMNKRLEESNSEIIALKGNLEKIKTESSKDFLTGLYNRRAFDEMFKNAIEDAREEGKPLTLMLLDVDYFKKYNDTYGHQLGDDVLRVVAKSVGDGLRGSDTIARYGGEEFIAILPNTPLDGAITVANKLRLAVAGKALRRKDTGEYCGNVTISVGVSVLRDDDTPESLVERADTALYKSKQDGRNRVTGS